jgi:hypothetical protein
MRCSPLADPRSRPCRSAYDEALAPDFDPVEDDPEPPADEPEPDEDVPDEDVPDEDVPEPEEPEPAAEAEDPASAPFEPLPSPARESVR